MVFIVFSRLAFLAAFVACNTALESVIISDLMTTSTDESKALEIKKQDFWQPMLASAEDAKMTSAYMHLSVYEEVETVVASLPEENNHVRMLLLDALTRLKRADQQVFQQAMETSDVASQQLLEVPGEIGAFSFLTGGQNYFAQAIRRFVGFGHYSDRAAQHVHQRQADVTPVLRGAAVIIPGILTDCREGSRLSFDALKYDIYTAKAPKTPEAARKAAYKLVDAIAETRHHFMQGITDAANSIARDSAEKDIDPSATVTRSLVQGLGTPVVAQRLGAAINF